ncbi:hypothetical protein [Solimonas flava]|uniref:hypothetical protein n=1 Tax=Solimonas flava TaxID=415849 RepID=UPI0012B52E13|nr:hypothetical protein [Solimonas flava]
MKDEFPGLRDFELDRKFDLVAYDDPEEPPLSDDRGVFSDILRYGRDPKRKFHARARKASPSVYDVVHEGGMFDDARAWYESPLWDFLQDKGKTRADYQKIVSAELTRRNIRSVEDLIEEAFGADAARTTYAPSRSPCPISGDTPFNSLLLLCALFKEQHLNPSSRYLEHVRAILVHETSRLKAHAPFNQPLKINISEKFNAPRDFGLFHLLDFLIEDRLFNDEWLSKDEAFLSGTRRPDFNSKGLTYKTRNGKSKASNDEAKGERRSPEHEMAKIYWYVGLHLQGGPNSKRRWERRVLREY